MIDLREFRERWQQWYPGTVPRGWAMRGHADRWLRIHSLPGGKRYPATAAERLELLARYNAVADAIVRGAPCVLLGYDEAGRYRLPDDHAMRVWLTSEPPVMRIAPEEDEEEATSVFAGELTWRAGLLDALLLQVAEDRLRLMLVNWSDGAVFAPYDGGADLFWPTPAERDRARIEFGDWLSALETGL